MQQPSRLGGALGLVLLTLSGAAEAQERPSVKWSGYLQVREAYREGTGLSGSINRARVTASGSAARNVVWRIQGEFRTGTGGTGKASVSLQDAFVRYQPGSFGLQMGQFKTPFGREWITSLADLETVDRATVIDSLAPKRDIGLMADYAFGPDASLALGVFNGEGQNLTSNSDSSVLVVSRLAIRPVSYVSIGANVARYDSDSTRFGIDLTLSYMGATIRGEYLAQPRSGVAVDDKGWYGLAAYRVFPWIQLVLRHEEFQRSAISEDSRNQATTGGVNVDFNGGKIRLAGNYVARRVGTPGIRLGMWIAQAQARF